MKTTTHACSLGTLIIFVFANYASAQFTVLHDFTSGIDGGEPFRLLYDGTSVFGTAFQGGKSNAGTVWSYATSSNTFTTQYNFAPQSDGRLPFAIQRDAGVL